MGATVDVLTLAEDALVHGATDCSTTMTDVTAGGEVPPRWESLAKCYFLLESSHMFSCFIFLNLLLA